MAQEGSIGAGRQPRLGKLFLMKLSYIADSPADCFHGLCIDSLFCFFKLFFRHSDGVFSKVAAVKELCIVKEALVPTLANLTDNAVHDLGGRQLLTKHLFRPSRYAGGQFHFIKAFFFRSLLISSALLFLSSNIFMLLPPSARPSNLQRVSWMRSC